MGFIAAIVALFCGLAAAPIFGFWVASRRQKKHPEASWWLWFLLGTFVLFPIIVVVLFVGVATFLLRNFTP